MPSGVMKVGCTCQAMMRLPSNSAYPMELQTPKPAPHRQPSASTHHAFYLHVSRHLLGLPEYILDTMLIIVESQRDRYLITHGLPAPIRSGDPDACGDCERVGRSWHYQPVHPPNTHYQVETEDLQLNSHLVLCYNIVYTQSMITSG